MKKQMVVVSIEVEVFDEKEFRQAAYEQALKEKLDKQEAQKYLRKHEMSLGDCAVMLIDPGVSPPGCQIEQSSSLEVTL